MKQCKNCGHEYEGNFCPNCGQKYIDKRYNLKDSIVWFFNSIFNLDHGFLYTTKELVVKPGHVIRSVLNGITINYTHPFRLLFIWATINTLAVIFFGTFDEQTAEITNSFEYSEAQQKFQQEVNAYMKKYLNFVIMLNIPFFSIFSGLLYRKRKFNFAEHLIINSYAIPLLLR